MFSCCMYRDPGTWHQLCVLHQCLCHIPTAGTSHKSHGSEAHFSSSSPCCKANLTACLWGKGTILWSCIALSLAQHKADKKNANKGGRTGLSVAWAEVPELQWGCGRHGLARCPADKPALCDSRRVVLLLLSPTRPTHLLWYSALNKFIFPNQLQEESFPSSQQITSMGLSITHDIQFS